MRMWVADIELSVPMLAQQRTWLLDELMKIDPPQSVPQGYEPYLGIIVCTKLNTESLKEVFDESQLKAIKQFQQKGQQYAGAVKW